jgi:hypothetical protein
MIRETKCTSETLDKISSKCRRGCFSIKVDAEGALGGLDILYNPSEITLSHFFTTRHSISTKFQLVGSDQIDYITNVSRPQVTQEKLSFLDSLYLLIPLFNNQPWLLGRDFNIISSLSKNKEVSISLIMIQPASRKPSMI